MPLDHAVAHYSNLVPALISSNGSKEAPCIHGSHVTFNDSRSSIGLSGVDENMTIHRRQLHPSRTACGTMQGSVTRPDSSYGNLAPPLAPVFSVTPSLSVFSNPRSFPCRRYRFQRSLATRLVETHFFLIASLRPTLLALFTASARFTLPIWRRFIFEGFGSFKIHSGTDEPDCSKTFAILSSSLVSAWRHGSVYVTRRRRDDTRNTYVFRNGASSFVKYVIAFPSLPARPVRPSARVSVSNTLRTSVEWDHCGHPRLTDSMDIALHALREVIVDDFSDTLEVHASRHDFRANHDPAFPTPHACDGVFPFLASHTGMQAVHIRYAIEHELFCQRRCARLRRNEHEKRWIVRLGQILQKGRQLGRIIRDVCERLRDERQRRVPESLSVLVALSGWAETHFNPTTTRIGSRSILMATFSAPAGRVALNTAFWTSGCVHAAITSWTCDRNSASSIRSASSRITWRTLGSSDRTHRRL